MVTFTSCSLLTRGPSGDGERTKAQITPEEPQLPVYSKHFLTLSGGAPASDGAFHEQRQRRHPDVDGSDEVVELQWFLQLHQSNVALFRLSVVAVMNEDHGDSHQLSREMGTFSHLTSGRLSVLPLRNQRTKRTQPGA